MAGRFKQWSQQDVVDLIDEYPLALVLSPSAERLDLTPLPMLADVDADGHLARLVGHMALRNPHFQRLRDQPRAWFLFLGPNGYISPTLVRRPAWGPTWNYAVAWVDAEVEFRPQENDRALRRLVERMEGRGPDAWSVESMGERYESLSQWIVAFEARVRSVDATFKLGQDERPDVFGQILEGLGPGGLGDWMRRFRRQVE